MRSLLPRAALLLAFLTLPWQAAATSPKAAASRARPPQAAGSAPEPAVPVVIGTEYTLRSKVLNEERKYFVALPPGYEGSTERYPVLYLLDGERHFHHATGITRFLAESVRIPRMIVVGVPNTQRTRDLTPPTRGDWPRDAGGADRFLRFLHEELAPTLEARYRTQPYRILVGHSFGGLFAVHVLMNSPQHFNAYVAISPSLAWNDRELVKGAAKSLERLPAGERWLYMTVGNEGNGMIDPIQALVQTLEKARPARLRWHHAFLEKEHHGSTPHRSLYDGLEAIFEGFDVPRALLETTDIAKLNAHYASMTERFGFEIRPPESTLNYMGYQLLRRGQATAAVAFFRKNVELYGATSANVHDSLGEAFEAVGQKQEAATSYERAWKLATAKGHPGAADFKERMERARQEGPPPAHQGGEGSVK